MLARIKVGDKVQVISGKEKGKRGEIIAISKDKSKVKVRNLFLVWKYSSSQQSRVAAPGVKSKDSSGMHQVERFIHACKVMPICPETDRPCRVRIKVSDLGKKIRVSHLSGAKI